MKIPFPTFAVLFLSLGLFPAGGTPALYDPDPWHPWNRLYSVLIRPHLGAGSQLSAPLDPPSFRTADQETAPAPKVLTLLKEFTESIPPESANLKRALMQRDLLAIFHEMASGTSMHLTPEDWAQHRHEVSEALVRAIRHLALPAKEIRVLPDNFALASQSAAISKKYDAEQPGPFLPGDLLQEGSDWILLHPSGSGSVTAPTHFKLFQGQSAFEVRMRHPEGRAAGEAYLKSLAEMPDPWVSANPPTGARPDQKLIPNPATPQFPPGTMWSLVRRAILADQEGLPVVSPLVESVQIRVYRSILERQEIHRLPAFQSQLKALEKEGKEYDYDNLFSEYSQTVFEWEMRRDLLLNTGGFHLTAPEDLKYRRYFHVAQNRPVSGFCAQCHSAAGIHSVQSRNRIFEEMLARPPELRPSNREELDPFIGTRARLLPGWILLHWLWKKEE